MKTWLTFPFVVSSILAAGSRGTSSPAEPERRSVTPGSLHVVLVSYRNDTARARRITVRARFEGLRLLEAGRRPYRGRAAQVRGRVEAGAVQEFVLGVPVPDLAGRPLNLTLRLRGRGSVVESTGVGIHFVGEEGSAPERTDSVPGPVPFHTLQFGIDSEWIEGGSRVARSGEELEALLAEGNVAEPAPWNPGEPEPPPHLAGLAWRPWPVDFEREMVLAVLPGSTAADSALKRLAVLGVEAGEDGSLVCRYRLRVRRFHRSPSPGLFDVPFHLITVPRTDRPVTFVAQ